MNQPANILIVDDTPENLTVLRDILVRAGYRVRPVLQGMLALKTAAAEPPDLILLDIMMPVMDGYETCRRLKEDQRTRDVPVLFISALDATESKVRGFDAGALDYILKPFRAEEVLARVRTHLALHAAQRQLRAQNEELLQAARLREDVDHMLRHDLRGPLGNMISYAELILEDAAHGSKTAAQARVITNAGYAVLNMVHASFDLMKMERGEYRLKTEAFDLVEVIRQIVAELELAASQKRVYFELSFADKTVTDVIVQGERLLSHSLFYNLAKNAIEASLPDQPVGIRFIQTIAVSEVSIRNTGAVPAGIRERFFEKYVTQGKADGTGLGTFSAKLMAETQRGGIRLDCSEPEHTSIAVRLPAATAAEKASFRQEKARAAHAQTLHLDVAILPVADLLIADDDAANRAYLQHILPAPPLKLHFATNGREALQVLQSQPIAAALIDLEMPELNGLEVARQYQAWVRSQPMDWPVAALLAFSGHQDEATREHCLDAGFARLLPKPTAKDKLYEELKQVLTLSRSIVLVDKSIESLIPEFLASQRAQVQDLAGLLAAGDGQAIGSLAHRLQGSLAMYGFHTASRIATGVSEAARASDLERTRALIADLQAHLDSLEVQFV